MHTERRPYRVRLTSKAFTAEEVNGQISRVKMDKNESAATPCR